MSSSTESKIFNILTSKTLMESTLVSLIKRKYSQSDITVNMTGDITKLKKLETTKPFFSEAYLLIFYASKLKKDDRKAVVKIVNSLEFWDVLIVHDTKESFDDFCNEFPESKQCNLYDPPEWLIDRHIKMYMIGMFSLDGYEAFMKRMRGQWKYLDEFIVQFNLLVEQANENDESEDEFMINAKIVKQVIPIISNINFFKMLTDILLGHSMKTHVAQLSAYRYAYKFTYEALTKELDNLIKIKKDIKIGNLKMTNLIDYGKKNSYSYYRVKQYYELAKIPSITLEQLYKVKHKLLKYKSTSDALISFLLDSSLLD